jgi:pimeloyl-ACP methyl ester carboxylesterase
MALLSIANDAVSLVCEERGSGPVVVLLHGFPLDRHMWDAQIEALSGDFRVLAPDLRGFGQSMITPFDVEVGVPMEKYAADLRQMLDTLGVRQPVVLVGFSMGGYAAFQFVLRNPDRVRGLVLCDTRSVADTEEARTNRKKMAADVLAANSAEPALAMMPKLLSPHTPQARPAVAEQVRGMILRQSPAPIAAAQRGMARRENVTPRLAQISCRALGIVGVDDAISPPKEMREIAGALPHARLVEIPNAGHMAPMENPEAVSQAIGDFARSIK